MPNHCTNHLCITGPFPERDAFMKTLKIKGYHEDWEDGTFCFHQTVPMPDSVFRGDLGRAEEIAYPGEKNWRDWAINNWGTKWANYDTGEVEEGSKSIKVTFQTAWGPPDKWLEAVSAKFPTLKFSLSWSIEGGNGDGRHEAKNGVLTQTR